MIFENIKWGEDKWDKDHRIKEWRISDKRSVISKRRLCDIGDDTMSGKIKVRQYMYTMDDASMISFDIVIAHHSAATLNYIPLARLYHEHFASYSMWRNSSIVTKVGLYFELFKLVFDVWGRKQKSWFSVLWRRGRHLAFLIQYSVQSGSCDVATAFFISIHFYWDWVHFAIHIM